MKSGACVFCGGVVPLPDQVQPGRGDLCARCGGYVHCCRQCRFYDPRAHHQCHEPQVELVLDKTQANFCDYFEFQGGTGAADPQQARIAESRSKLDALFRKG